MLERSGKTQVSRHSNNRVTRYFRKYLKTSRVTRNIMIFVLQNEFCTFNEIVDYVGKAPSTISWHIKRLRKAGILRVINGSDLLLYSVTDKDLVDKVLSKYKEHTSIKSKVYRTSY